jgi:hypothetical protein
MPHTTIHVTFVESATGQILRRADLTVDQLPASFETSTTLHLGDEDWHVERAEPMRADEFSRIGLLTLTLSRITRMDPKKILYTLPTLNAAIPLPNEQISDAERPVYQLHEDDWRQIEFVSAMYAQEIKAELADIAAIFREQSVDNGSFLGFRELHMRQRIVSPLDPPLTLQQVWAALGVNGGAMGAVACDRMPGIVPASYAFQADDLLVYGSGEAAALQCLCIHQRSASVGEPTLSGWQRLMSAHRLYLVDWCRMLALAPDDAAALVRYFSGQ